MRHPLLPVAILAVVVILVTELSCGLFSRIADPSRSADYYGHHVCDDNWMLVRVASQPATHNRSIGIVADVLQISDSNGITHNCNGKIKLFLPKEDSITLAFGDELLIWTSPKKPLGSVNPHQFDYQKYLAYKGILYTSYLFKGTYKLVGAKHQGLRYRISALRQRLIDVIRFSSLSPTRQSIAEALFLGWDDDISEDTERLFKTAGITHLLCVSGLHVGIVALLSGWLLFFLSNRKRDRIIKGIIQLAIIWFFVVITGMAPGTSRAGLIFSLIVLGKMFFSKPPTVNSIAASALILLVCNPLLVFDIGFQLSYSSVLGIVLFKPSLEACIPLPQSKNKIVGLLIGILREVRSLACISIAAQATTSPFILLYFHSFPLYFLVANIIVVPFAGLLLGSIILLTLTSFWPWLFNIMGWVVSVEIGALEWLTSVVASWPNAILENIYFDHWMFVLLLVSVLFAGFALRQRLWSLLSVALAALLVLIIYGTSVERRCNNQSHFDIYRLRNRTAIEFFAGHTSYLLCDSIIAQNPHSIDFQTSNNLLYRKAERKHILALDTTFDDGILKVEKGFAVFNGTIMRIVDRGNYREHSHFRPHLDYLLLRESPYITVSELKEGYDFDTLVILSQNSQKRRSSWIEQCDSLNVPYLDYR